MGWQLSCVEKCTHMKDQLSDSAKHWHVWLHASCSPGT